MAPSCPSDRPATYRERLPARQGLCDRAASPLKNPAESLPGDVHLRRRSLLVVADQVRQPKSFEFIIA